MARRPVKGLVAMVIGGGLLWGEILSGPVPGWAFSWDVVIRRVNYSLEYFTVDEGGTALGARGGTLYRIIDQGDDIEKIHGFRESIQGIHVLRNGVIIVSTDRDRWNPHTPCRIYRSRDHGATFTRIKTVRAGCALWWSLASDRHDHLYLGEYGPRGRDQSKTVWKTTDGGETWEEVFRAPNIDGVHIHCVAVDPYTDFVWVIHGDTPFQGTYLSEDGGMTWTYVRYAQSTSVAFTEDAIFWGEDTYRGAVTRYDRKTRRFQTVLDASQQGAYGGSIYSMAVGPSGRIFVPMVKYVEQSHVPTLWVGDGWNWELLMRIYNPPKGEGGFLHISNPDQYGNLYIRGFKITERSRLSSQNRTYVLQVENGIDGVTLSANYPNPFNIATTIRFALPSRSDVELAIFNLAGQQVATLVEGVREAGTYTVRWDGRDDSGRELASGVYLYRLQTSDGRQMETRKLLLLR